VNSQTKLAGVRQHIFFPELEALRGIAALTVVVLHCFHVGLFHFASVLGPKQLAELGLPSFVFGVAGETIFNGRSAVLLFFILSGFVMGANLDTTKPLTVDAYAMFLIRRFFRLIPPVWAAVFFSIVLSIAVGDLIYDPGTNALVKTAFGWKQIFEYFTLRDTSIDPALWSLVVEIFACLVYLPLLYCSRSVGLGLQIVGINVVFALQIEYASAVRWGNVVYIFPLFMFYLGIIAPSVGRRIVEALSPKTASAFAVAAYIFIVSPELLETLLQFDWGSLTNDVIKRVFAEAPYFVPLSAFYLVSWVAYGEHGMARRFLNRAPAIFLGRISYSVYILHMPIVFAIFALLQIYGPVGSRAAQTILVIVVSIPVTLVCADACRRVVELPSIEIGRRVVSRLKQTKPGGWYARSHHDAVPPDNPPHRRQATAPPAE
jgi:peptidoglycan/LPS O-acetylase OafA/YrhL